MPKLCIGKVVKNAEVRKDIFEMEIASDYLVENVKPGQFINIKCEIQSSKAMSLGQNVGPILRRPISISDVNFEEKTFTIIFRLKGDGTKILSQYIQGDEINFIGPLGNGFKIVNEFKQEDIQRSGVMKKKNIVIVGGGMGTFPLLFLLKTLNKENIRSFLGFQSKAGIILEKEFASLSKLTITTDDLSLGKVALVTEAFKSTINKGNYDIVFACGPKAMLMEVDKITKLAGIPCQMSLEENMGCGIGSCLVCACKTKVFEDDIQCKCENEKIADFNNQKWKYSRVCKDGPVFMGGEIIWE